MSCVYRHIRVSPDILPGRMGVWRAGANLDVDVSWKYLRFFLEDDDELKKIGEQYGSGSMMTRDVKERLIEVMPRARA